MTDGVMGASKRSGQKRRGGSSRNRYPGHDRLYGCSEVDTRRELCQWLFATARHRRYLWPLVAGALEFHGTSGETHVESHRKFSVVVARLLTDVDSLAQNLWAEVELSGRLSRELAKWHAYRELAALAERHQLHVPQQVLVRTWRELLQLHHASAQAETSDLTVVPQAWLGATAHRIALARRYAERVRRGAKEAGCLADSRRAL
jgi:hypothetical protein